MSSLNIVFTEFNNQIKPFKTIIDLVIVGLLLIVVLAIVFKKTKDKKIFLTVGGYLVFGIIAYLFDLTFLKLFLVLSAVVLSICYICYHTIDGKHASRNYNNSKTTKNYITNEDAKTKLIETLLKTTKFFSERRIGAIITIEREANLNTTLEKGATKLDAEVTFELLESIFHPNTALHDGAVIIRGNRILCAGAFYTPSDKADIPQHYGSRHRAAIGISEETDAFTIIVSEESGSISTTIGGTITSGLSQETLEQLLNQHIIVK